MKKLRFNTLIQLVVLPLAVVCLLSVVLHSNQAMLAGPVQQTFTGEYSQNGGPWQPLEEDTRLSALDGDLLLRGHLSYDVLEGGRLYFYRNHIGVTISVNGEILLETAHMENGIELTSSMCGRDWYCLDSPGISTEDEVEIRLHNPHSTGNKSAYEDFLHTLYNSDADLTILEKHFEPYSLPFKAAGVVLMVFAFMLVGAALTAGILKISISGMLWKVGLLALFGGGYVLLDVIDLSFSSELMAFNTYGWLLCMMLFVLFLGLLALSGLSEKRRKAAELVIALEAALDAVLFLCSLIGGMLLYDGLPYWMAGQAVFCLVLLTCCLGELRAKPQGGKMLPASCGILFTTVLLDLAGVGKSIYSKGTCTKFVFFLLALLLLIQELKNVVENHQASIKAKKLEAELEESRIDIMRSQIQPHFLFNTLTSIYQFCEVDPARAQQAIGTFSKYLRGNLDSLDRREPIPFEEELHHVEAYLSLEKMRFGDKLTAVYHIGAGGFMIPALTVQPLVENAVKHSVGKKRSGGTVTITAREEEQAYIVVVSDDGIGFDVSQPPDDGRPHVGLKNVRERLRVMCGGTLAVASVPGKGTDAVITIPKGAEDHEDHRGG